MRKIEFAPLDGPLGARVVGASPTLDFDPDQIRTVKNALAQYHVLVFEPAQRTDRDLNRFMSRIGTPMGTPGLDRDDDSPDDQDALTTRDEHNVLRVEDNPDHPSPVLRNNDFEWHTDQGIFAGIRGTETILQSEVIPEDGGDTYFVSTYGIYDDLPNAVKARLDGVRVMGDQRAYTEGFFDPELARAVNPGVTGDHDPVGAALTWVRELARNRKARRSGGLMPAGAS